MTFKKRSGYDQKTEPHDGFEHVTPATFAAIGKNIDILG